MSASMPIDELVAINSLLIKRETELAALNQFESALSQILGEPFPFTRPKHPLPSTLKRQAAKTGKRPKAKKIKKIRRLKPGEFAYRVTTMENGKSISQDLVDISVLQNLLEHPLPHHRIQSIQTLSDSLQVIDTLIDN